jgi:integrating conjugative element protein (TIGR03758 family)
MSMSGTQSSAFKAAAGFPASAGYTLFVGFAIAISLLWAAWAVYSCYRGWATGNLDRLIALPAVVRSVVLCLILAAFVLS